MWHWQLRNVPKRYRVWGHICLLITVAHICILSIVTRYIGNRMLRIPPISLTSDLRRSNIHIVPWRRALQNNTPVQNATNVRPDVAKQAATMQKDIAQKNNAPGQKSVTPVPQKISVPVTEVAPSQSAAALTAPKKDESVVTAVAEKKQTVAPPKKAVASPKTNPKNIAPKKQETKAQSTPQNAPKSEKITVGRDEVVAIDHMRVVQDRLRARWTPPVGSPAAGCDIAIYLDNKARVKKVTIIRPSGSLVYDMSVRRAARAITYPSVLKNTRIPITFKR